MSDFCHQDDCEVIFQKKLGLEKGRTSSVQDQERYNYLINKPILTDADREELARLYKKYTV